MGVLLYFFKIFNGGKTLKIFLGDTRVSLYPLLDPLLCFKLRGIYKLLDYHLVCVVIIVDTISSIGVLKYHLSSKCKAPATSLLCVNEMKCAIYFSLDLYLNGIQLSKWFYLAPINLVKKQLLYGQWYKQSSCTCLENQIPRFSAS